LKLFLSYASPDKADAEAIQLALLGAGHQVFFDRASLPPGSDYNSRIREAIGDSEAFIFLISPNSVKGGRYLQSELKFAKKKWPKPWGAVLPVMISHTEMDLIDKYLSSITILEPTGSVPAEVAAAVGALQASTASKRSELTGREGVATEIPRLQVSPHLEIFQEDILESSGGMLVCPVNPTLFMSDGLQLKVRKQVGMQLQLKILRYAFRFPLGKVRVESGNDKWPYIAIANSSGRPGHHASKEEGAISQIVYAALERAEALNIDTIHLPLLGSGFGKLTDEKSLLQTRAGLERYESDHVASNVSLRLYIHDPERFIAVRKMLA